MLSPVANPVTSPVAASSLLIHPLQKSAKSVTDITARELHGGGIVEGAAGYGATGGLRAAMPVHEDGIAVPESDSGPSYRGHP